MVKLIDEFVDLRKTTMTWYRNLLAQLWDIQCFVKMRSVVLPCKSLFEIPPKVVNLCRVSLQLRILSRYTVPNCQLLFRKTEERDKIFAQALVAMEIDEEV